MLSSFASIVLALIPLVAAVDPLVDLGYASYRGTVLNNGITQWMGIPYAAPPTGKNRFAPPQDLDIPNEVYEAHTHGPACMSVSSDPDDPNYSEDCLKLDVYAPSGYWPTQHAVFFYIAGGGFSESSQPPNVTKMIQSSKGNIMVVTLTYRVGPYGFLGGKADGLSPNNGLKDQQKALRWIRKHIAKFGGNPDHIVLGGARAGGGSVVLQMANLDNKYDFVGVATESAAFPALLTAEEGQFILNSVTKRAGCAENFDCIRNMDSLDLQTRLRDFTLTTPGTSGKPVYMYGPTLDSEFVKPGDFAANYPYRTFLEGAFKKIPAIFGDNTYESDIFMPTNISTLEEADAFITSQYPKITFLDLVHIHALPNYKPYMYAYDFWGFADRLHSDLRYTCPNIFLPYILSTKTKIDAVWNYRWNAGPANDTSESGPIWDGGPNPSPANLIHHYWVSFIMHLDPNEAKSETAPTWVPSGGKESFLHNRLVFDRDPETRMEMVDVDQWNACVYLNNKGVEWGH